MNQTLVFILIGLGMLTAGVIFFRILFKRTIIFKFSIILLTNALITGMLCILVGQLGLLSLLWALPLGFFILMVSNFLVIRMIQLPLKRLTASLDQLASGNLGITIDNGTKEREDEMGIIASSIEELGKRLTDIVKNITTCSENLVEVSKRINTEAEEISSGAAIQAYSAGEVSTSVEEMSLNIQQNADNSKIAEKISNESYHAIMIGNDLVAQATQSMKEIAGKIAIIGDIAFQTNILALNAAVEAARAGEHGKGFSVVATEVRKLAELSKTAADQINAFSQTGVANSEKAANELNTIVPSIEKAARLVQEITLRNLEQNEGSEKINKAIQELNYIIQQNTASTHKLGASSNELLEDAEQLKKTIQYFRRG